MAVIKKILVLFALSAALFSVACQQGGTGGTPGQEGQGTTGGTTGGGTTGGGTGGGTGGTGGGGR